MPNSNNIFQLYANYRKASRYLFKADVVAQLEYYEDIPFWSTIFQYSRPSKKIKFYYADRINGTKQSGKTVCKHYIPYADSSLVVCVDSDFDLLLDTAEYSVTNYVLQTYTYSWENHYCYKSSLQKHWAQMGVGNFDFTTFVDGLNTIIFPSLIKILTAKSNRIQGWHLLDFCGKVLHPSVCKRGVLNNNGVDLLKAIQLEVSNWEKTQPAIPSSLVCQMMKSVAKIGLISDTAYLYVRGHCIYDLICNIGAQLSGKMIAFKQQVLEPALQLSGYLEMDNLIRDAKTVL